MIEKYLPENYSAVEIFGNSLAQYIEAITVFIAFLVIFKIFQVIVLGKLAAYAKKTKTDLDDTFIKIVKTLRPPFYSFLAFYFALSFLILNELLDKLITIILIIWVVYQVIYALQVLIDYAVRKKMGKEEEAGAKAAVSFLSKLAKIILWSFGFLFVLSNLGINVTSLVAGLGIGGVAIAFALQNVLSDLFSSFAIYFDRPFIVGDFIIVGDKMGVVEKIGIKTTRIKALQGEEIVMSNNALTSSIVQNFKKMRERRIVFSIGVTYNTSLKKLQRALEVIKRAIESQELARLDRAHFKQFDESALLIEAAYYVRAPEYNKYMDANQEILFNIKLGFEKEKIEMAFPTRTIYIEK